MRQVFKVLSSLWLTVALLALSMVLVFVATFDQVDWGVYEVQKRYFETFIAIGRYPTLFPGSQMLSGLRIPLPGGFLLGALLVVNLLCAHFRYFRASWKKCGIAILHAGVLLLIVSGFATAYFQEEYYMWINVGGRANYIESFHDVELAFVDRTDPDEDKDVSIPVAMLASGETIRHPALPFTVKPMAYYRNSGFALRSQDPRAPELAADQGVARNRDLSIFEQPYNYTAENRNMASAIVALESPSGPLGKWVASTAFDPKLVLPVFARDLPQTFTVDGRTWEIMLRQRREYLPFTLQLDKFIHEKYPGTQVPKRFESQVRLTNRAHNEDRPVLIYMNHPLRHGGLTFYQASFDRDNASMLQVVRNPGWPLPYIAVAMVGVGMVVQFLISLLAYLRRESARAAEAPSPAGLPQNAAIRSP